MTCAATRHLREDIYLLLLIHVTFEGSIVTSPETKQHYQKIIDAGLIELFSPLGDRKIRQYTKSVGKAIDATVRKFAETAPDDLAGEKLVLTTYCFLQLLAESNTVTLVDGKPLTEMVEHMLNLLDVDSELTQKRLKNANKVARKWLESLKEIEYFIAD